jgi:hypothetical protein
MLPTIRAAAAVLLAVAACTVLADPPATEPIKDRTGFIPSRKQEPLKGTVVGILLYDGQPVLSTEGRSGPPDQLCFGHNGNSYRWVYVPTMGKAQISNLRVPVGEKEGQVQIFPSLDIARPHNVTPWGVTSQYSLVEVEVNSGLGSPKNDSFVATRLKVLDGTSAYPLRTAEVVKQLKARYADYVKEQGKVIETIMSEAQQKALKDGKATGPRETTELMFLTWLPQSESLRAHFRTKISDGQYSYVDGGAVPPGKRLPQPPGPGAKIRPPFPQKFKVGVTFGVEFGMAYEVSKEGKLVQTQSLPPVTFQTQLPPPPRIGPRPVPLPLPPAK